MKVVIALLSSAIVMIICLSSVCITRVYCDKTPKARIMQFSLKVAECLCIECDKFEDEIQRSPLGLRLKLW